MRHKEEDVNRLWGGRFREGPTKSITRMTASIQVDQRLAFEDLEGSKSHIRMLTRQGIVTEADGEAIEAGLEQIRQEIAEGRFAFKERLEDIHMNIEARLTELIGSTAGRLHTARSRNDQVATDLRLWIRREIDALDDELRLLQQTLLRRAEEGVEIAMPGFTHLQPAQPLTLGFHFLAYLEMFGRDRGRLKDARKRLNECPLGSAALAGTSYPIDRDYPARELGFDRPTANALDSVSDRDFVVEYLSGLSLCGVHLSRLAEEIILWCSQGFGFIALPDSLTTGSSIMPQKRNPDGAELVRGKSARLISALTTVLMVLKGLPLAYAKDLQEDKEPVFDATDTIRLMIEMSTLMVKELTIHDSALRAQAERGYLTATDLADWLTRVLDVPFRQAHWITGRLVGLAADKGIRLEELDLETMRQVEPRITAEVYKVLPLDAAIRERSSYGGTAPETVRQAIAAAKERFSL